MNTGHTLCCNKSLKFFLESNPHSIYVTLPNALNFYISTNKIVLHKTHINLLLKTFFQSAVLTNVISTFYMHKNVYNTNNLI